MTTDREVLEMALVGFRQKRQEVEAKIADLEQRLNGGRGRLVVAAEPGRRKLSPAARRRIAAAQKKRWAAWRKTHGVK